MNRIGIDLGGTKIEGILIGESGNVLARKRIPTRQEEGYEAILNRIVSLILELKSMSSLPVHIGVGIPGAMSPRRAVIKNSNTVCLIGKPLQQDIAEKIGLPIAMANDANCFALAESMLGAGKPYNNIFGVILGTGCGGGIIINNTVHCGADMIAGEWGHHKIDPNGPLCYCGHHGCTEAFISGPALERRWASLTGETLPLQEIVECTTHRSYPQWESEFLRWFGIALSNVVNILDPDAIILGGGVSNIPFLYTKGKQSVDRYVISNYSDVTILQNKLGDSAGVFGAAFLEEWT